MNFVNNSVIESNTQSTNTTNMPSYNLSSFFDFTKIHDDEYVASKNLTKYVSEKHGKRTILKYKKQNMTEADYKTMGMFRSVICDYDGKVICFAPPKTMNSVTFGERDVKNVEFQQFIEGTMINVYNWNGDWHYATRSMLSGQGRFFNREKTFGQMFCEINIEHDIYVEKFNPDYVYSFVMQHKENRIVKDHQQNILYLTNMYKINNNEDGTVTVDEVTIDREEECLKNPGIKFPQTFRFYSFVDASQTFANPAHTTPYDIQGVFMVDTTTGERSKMRNPVFEKVRKLRGNQPKIQYTYMELRKQQKVGEFLTYYPEFKSDFSKFRAQIHTFTDSLIYYYQAVNVDKVMTIKTIPYEFRPHVYHLHGHYIRNLFPEKKIVNRQEAINYVNSLEVPRLMYSINFVNKDFHAQEKVQSSLTETTESANVSASAAGGEP
jgi:hypothetical protein